MSFDMSLNGDLFIMDRYIKSILRQLYVNGPQTRTELMRALKMRQNAIVDVCNILEDKVFVKKSDMERQRNVPLELNPSKFAVIGIEHRPDELQLVMINGNREKTDSKVEALPESISNGKRLERMIELTEKFKNSNRKMTVAAIGIADVGIVDMAKGTGLFSAHVNDWKDVDVCGAFSERFKVPCNIIDRINASCLESNFRNSKPDDQPSCIQVWITDGIGVSIMHNGDFWGRSFPFSGQLGHTVVMPGGEVCRCGNRGCLETVASIPAVVACARSLTGDKTLELDEVMKKASAGDRVCGLVLREAGEALGLALANLVTLIGVPRLSMRSRLCSSESIYLAAVKSELEKNVIFPFNRELDLSVNDQDADSSALGAALFAQKQFFACE